MLVQTLGRTALAARCLLGIVLAIAPATMAQAESVAAGSTVALIASSAAAATESVRLDPQPTATGGQGSAGQIFLSGTTPAGRDEAAAVQQTGASQFRSLFNAWGIGAAAPASSGTQAFVPKADMFVPSIRPVRVARMTSHYGYRTDPFRGRRANHKGLDLAGPIGTPIYATADGVVGRAQWLSGYGKYIELNHGNAVQTRYGHLSAMNVFPNQRVKKGDVIGFMGSTGRSTGSHLHYEVRIAGEPVNPLAFMGDDTDVTKDLMIVDGGDSDALGGPAGN